MGWALQPPARALSSEMPQWMESRHPERDWGPHLIPRTPNPCGSQDTGPPPTLSIPTCLSTFKPPKWTSEFLHSPR